MNQESGVTRNQIKDLISSISPYDSVEKETIKNSIAWIESGVEIFRITKPDVPPKHLVSYFCLIDKDKNTLLLINHIKAGKWLFPGGHIEQNEHPTDTVRREMKEELGIDPYFIIKDPLFITETLTQNIDAGHTDVSLYFLLAGDSVKHLVYDKREMKGYRWISFENVLKEDISTLDQHMHRFVKKLSNFLHFSPIYSKLTFNLHRD